MFLLDVNVLIALLDVDHLHHDRAASWFLADARGGWASCPLTENGVVRILCNPRYRGSPGSPGEIVRVLTGLCAATGHVFWPDAISIGDRSHIDAARIADAAQITDTYLLALAAANSGRLATFDRRLSVAAVTDGARYLHLIA